MTRDDRGAKLSSASRENLFFTSIEVIEFARLLETNEHTSKWGWLFTTYKHWHAVALILSELCVRPLYPITDRAWLAVHSVYGRLEQHAKHKKGMMWRPLAKLMKRAAAVRAKQREELQNESVPGSGVTGPTSFSPEQTGQSVDLNLPQFIPRIQAPFDSQPSIPVPSQVSFGQQPVMGLGVTSELFPETDFLAVDPNTQPPLAEADTSTGIPSAPMAPMEDQQVQSNSQLNWEEWDQVMRDFQMDLQRTQDSQPFGNVSDWLA